MFSLQMSPTRISAALALLLLLVECRADEVMYIDGINAPCFAYCWEVCQGSSDNNACNSCQDTGSEWLYDCNATSCEGRCQTFGSIELVPPPVTIEAFHLEPNFTSVTWRVMNWGAEGSQSQASSAGDEVLVVIIQYRRESNQKWKFLTMGSEASGEFQMDSQGSCQQFEFRAAAVNKNGTLGFNEMLIKEEAKVSSLSMEEPKLKFDGINTITARLRWAIDQEWAMVMEKSTVTANKECVNKEARGSVNQNIVTIEGGPFSAKLSFGKEFFGCKIPLEIESFSTCNPNFFKVKNNFILHLTDCQKIRNFPCNSCEDGKLSSRSIGELRFPTQKQHRNKMAVLVEWDNPSEPSCNSVLYYKLKWGKITRLNTFLPALSSIEDLPDQEINVPGNETSYMMHRLDPSTSYGAKLFVIYRNNPDVKVDLNIVSTYVFSTVSLQPVTTAGIAYENYTPVKTGQVSQFTTLSPSTVFWEKSKLAKGSFQINNLIFYVGVPFVALLFICTFSLLVLCLCRRRRRASKRANNHVVAKKEVDKWEIPWEQINFGIFLGHGEFGQVYRGKIGGAFLQKNDKMSDATPNHSKSPPTVTVTVETLHEMADETQKEEFLQKLKMMKTMGYHCNVISLIACCTVREPSCLIVEHCERGTLQNYLRQKRDELLKHEQAGVEEEEVVKEDTLSPKDILSFARQITIGMEFLGQMGVIHRNLSAQNMMMAEHKVIKICDSGLSRHIDEDKVRTNQIGGRLLLKWMAIESIFDNIYQTSSNVWSFGIVLYELVTLGGTPYPGMSNQELIRRLRKGYRMEKPDNCNKEIYKLMHICWRDKPGGRPTFGHLRQQLEKMIGENTSYFDFNFDHGLGSSEGSSKDSVFMASVDDEGYLQSKARPEEGGGKLFQEEKAESNRSQAKSSEPWASCRDQARVVSEPEAECLLADERTPTTTATAARTSLSDQLGPGDGDGDSPAKELAEMESLLGREKQVLPDEIVDEHKV